MSSWRRPLLLVVAAALAAGGCTSSSDSSKPAPPTEVRIGLLTPMSGPNRLAGQDAQRGALLAADVVNGLNSLIPLPLAEESGLTNLGNARIRIITADTQSKAARGATETTRLVTDQGVVSVIGAYDPDVTLQASLIAERTPVPFVNGDSSLSFLTDRGLDWFFHLGPSVRTSGEAFFSLLKTQQGSGSNGGRSANRVAVLHSSDKAGNDVSNVIAELAQEGGFTLTKDVGYDPNLPNLDLSGKVGEIQATNPDVVFVSPTASTVPQAVQAFAARAYKPKAVMAYGSGFLSNDVLSVAGAATAGLCREAAWSYEVAGRNLAARQVSNLYQSKYNTPMTEEAASSFTTVLTLAIAINNAGSVDVRRIRSALLSLDIEGQDTIMPWKGIQFDDTHQNIGAASVIEQFLNKSFHAVFPLDSAGRNKLVWPAALAT
jgi:branched-chain amino acid transport system substrate-binding protein